MLSSVLSVLMYASVVLNPSGDPDRAHWLSFIENYCNSRSAVKTYKKIVSSQLEDGSWADVDYKSQLRGSWSAGRHANKFATLASAYLETGDKSARDAALKALEYWGKTKPVATNWWWNVVGVPRSMGPAFYILKNDLDDEHLAWALEVMDKSPFGMTGQNKVWRAGNVFFRALLADDREMMKKARDVIASEICVVTPDKEGIQQDWSYHQHGPQLQFGNYGLSYASGMSWWIDAFRDTDLAFSEEQVSIIENYVREGLRWVVWKGYFDQSACGRQVFRNLQKVKAKTAASAAGRLLMASEPEERGGRYFNCSDFGVYRSADWYASIRMQSRRVCGIEVVNGENMKSYFASDGALLTRIDGDEYFNISPCWNWKHIPGTTTYDDGKPLWGDGTGKSDSYHYFPEFAFNKTELVFGKAEGEYMVAAMDYVRDGMTARKAWFFTPDGVVCLGAGITRAAADPVVTTLEQNVLKGDVISGKNWISHRGVTYVVLDSHKIKVAPYGHSGNWRDIAPFEKDALVNMNIFEAWIEHGKAPKGESYAYVVAPAGKGSSEIGAVRARIVKKNVKILSNTVKSQKVIVSGKELSVDWTAGTAEIR